MMYNIKRFIEKYSYYGNIINIFDSSINKIITDLKNNDKNILSISIPNTIFYCLKYKKTYLLNIEILNENNLSIPLMVGSKYGNTYKKENINCYFIIDGKFKIIVNQEKRSFYNYCIIPKKEKKIYYCNNLKYNIEIYKNKIYLISKDNKNKINLINFFHDKKIIENDKINKLPYLSIDDCYLLNNNILKYCNDYENNKKYDKINDHEIKEIVLAFINILNGNMFDIYDDLYFSGIYTSGDIFFSIFKQNYYNKNNTFDEHIKNLFKIGQFSINNIIYQGVCQELSRRNDIDTISHIRRISKLNANNRNVPKYVRSLKSSEFGYVCCNETPESIDVGITKYLSLFSLITPSITKNANLKVLNFINNYKNKKDMYKLYLDNIFIKFIDKIFLESFKKYRIQNYDLKYVSIYCFKKNYYINTISGRYIRPLLVKNNIKLMNKNYTLKECYIKNITFF